MIRVYYNRGPGYISLVSTGHADPKVCTAECSLIHAAAYGIQTLAAVFPRQISFEAMEHERPEASILLSAAKFSVRKTHRKRG
jgi:hypothetical protein